MSRLPKDGQTGTDRPSDGERGAGERRENTSSQREGTKEGAKKSEKGGEEGKRKQARGADSAMQTHTRARALATLIESESD